MTHDATFWFHVARDLVRRPSLWWTAFRQLRRMIAPRWWSRRPFLPLPDATYVHYRMETAYGAHGVPNAADVITYLEWCRGGEHATPRRCRRALTDGAGTLPAPEVITRGPGAPAQRQL